MRPLLKSLIIMYYNIKILHYEPIKVIIVDMIIKINYYKK